MTTQALGEVQELKEAVLRMKVYSAIQGDMIMQMKLQTLDKTLERLEEALAKQG